jgi:hypothetical protein
MQGPPGFVDEPSECPEPSVCNPLPAAKGPLHIPVHEEEPGTESQPATGFKCARESSPMTFFGRCRACCKVSRGKSLDDEQPYIGADSPEEYGRG